MSNTVEINEALVDQNAMSLEDELNEMIKFKEDNAWMFSLDAQVWAKQFLEHKKKLRWTHADIDEDLMIGWFANAIMAGYDEATRRAMNARPNTGE